MWEILLDWMGSRQWMPHGMCFAWTPSLLWSLVISNSLIALAYYSIPLTLLILVRERRDLVHKKIFMLFALFIGACGTTHLIHVVTIWQPIYWVQGVADIATAGVSVTTAVLLWPLLPRILTLPSPAQMTATNNALQTKIAEHQAAEAALQKSEEMFRLLVEDSTNIVVLLDADAIIRYASPAYTQLLDYSPEEVMGQSCFARVHPDDLAKMQENFATILRTRGKMKRLEYRYQHKDGKWRVFETLCRNLLLDPGVARIVLNMRDITERKQAEDALRASEERFRLMVQGALDYALFMLDPQGNIVSWNVGAERLKGYQAEEILGQRHLRFYTDADLERGLPDHLLQIATEQGYVDDEGWRVRKDGSTFCASVTLTALRDETGQLRGFSKLVRNINERRQAEERVQSEQKRFAALLRVSSKLNRDLDLQAVLHTVCEEVASALDVPVVAVSLYDEGQQELFYAAGIGLPHEYAERVRPLSLADYEKNGMDSNATFTTPDVQILTELPNADIYAAMDLRTTVNSPLLREEQLIGRLNIGTIGNVRDFTEEEIHLLNGLATLAAQALTNARLYAQARLRLRRIQSLHTIDRAITTTQHVSATLAELVTQVAEQLEVDAVAVLSFDPEQRLLTYAAGTGFHREGLGDFKLHWGEGNAGHAASERRTIYSQYTHDQVADEGSVRAAYFATENIISHYSVPLVAHDKLVGVLELFHRAQLTPDSEWLTFLEALALQTAIAVDHAMLFTHIQAQARQLQQILNTIPDGVFLLDAEQRMVVANPTAQAYLPLLTSDAAPAPGDRIVHLGNHTLAEILEPTGETQQPDELTAQDGQSLFEIVTQTLRDNGKRQGWVILLRDVTEARHRLEALQQQERLATVGQLAAGIAHDFNNILTPMLLYAELGITQAPDGSPLQRNLQQMARAANRARDLVARILAFGRQNTGQAPRQVELHAVVEEALTLVRAILPSPIKLEAQLSEKIGFVMVDPTEIHQVVMNLCTNAYHAMQEGGGILQVTLDAVEVDQAHAAKQPTLHTGAYVRLTISDTGYGMDQATLSRIFDPFFTTKALGQGTGLGLAVVYGIVNKYDGAVEVKSKLDEGTTFTLYLPIAATSGPAARVLVDDSP